MRLEGKISIGKATCHECELSPLHQDAGPAGCSEGGAPAGATFSRSGCAMFRPYRMDEDMRKTRCARGMLDTCWGQVYTAGVTQGHAHFRTSGDGWDGGRWTLPLHPCASVPRRWQCSLSQTG
jgi:hypothetical protein